VGQIQDMNGDPVTSVKVEVSQFPDIVDYSDQSGKFVIEVSGKGSEYIDLVLKHKSYRVFRKKVKVDYDSEEPEIILEASTLETAYPPEQEEIQQYDNNTTRNPIEQNESNPVHTIDNTSNQSNNSGSTINIIYAGDEYGCIVDVIIDIAGIKLAPTGNSVYMYNVPNGIQNYSITGMIDCGDYGYCNTSGNDIVDIQNNNVYYLMWMNEDLDAHCDIGLLTQTEYNLLMGY
jgi:hypothetical protein